MPTTLARLLVEADVVSPQRIDDCLRRHVAVGGALDTVLLEAGACEEGPLLLALGRASGLPIAHARDFALVDPKVLAAFPYKLAERHGMVPIAMGRRHFDIAVCYPIEKLLLEEISFMLGKDLKPRISIEARIRDAVARLYKRPLSTRHANLLRKLGPPPMPEPEVVRAPEPPPAPIREPEPPPPEPFREPPPEPEPERASAVTPTEIVLEVVPEPPAPDETDETDETDSPFAPTDVEEDVRVLDEPPSPATEWEPPTALLLPEPPPLESLAPLAPAQETSKNPPSPSWQGRVPQAGVVAGRDFSTGFQPSEPELTDVSELLGLVTTPTSPLSTISVPKLRPPPVHARPLSRPVAEPVRRFIAWESPEEDHSLAGAVVGATLPPAPPPNRVVAEPVLLPTAPRPTPSPALRPRRMAGPLPAVASPSPGATPAPSQAEWSLTEARARLSETAGRDEIIDVALRFALKSFEYAAALAVRSGTAFGWAARSTGGALDGRIHRLALPLDAPSVLRTVLRARGRYLGPLPDDVQTRQLLESLGREAPRAALVYPVFVRDRAVAFFYADRGRRNVAAARVAEYLLFAQELATAFERAILRTKSSNVRAVAASTLIPPPRASRALSVHPSERANLLDDEPLFPITEEVPEPEGVSTARDVASSIDRLLRPDRRARLAALAELEAMPEQAAPALAARFPGPTSIRRGLVVALPEPEDIGPIPAALARLGPAAVPPLVALLREGDPDARFFAVLLVGALGDRALFPALGACLFDPVVEVAAAARAAAEALRKAPGFEEEVAQGLRVGLASADPERVSMAAQALGRTRDVRSIGLLIPLTGHADDRVAAEASEALTSITKQTLGDSPRRWQAWWEPNRQRSRLHWLVEGLAHKEIQVRLSSIDELIDETSDSFGYLADGPKREREKAIERWDLWLRAQAR